MCCPRCLRPLLPLFRFFFNSDVVAVAVCLFFLLCNFYSVVVVVAVVVVVVVEFSGSKPNNNLFFIIAVYLITSWSKILHVLFILFCLVLYLDDLLGFVVDLDNKCNWVKCNSMKLKQKNEWISYQVQHTCNSNNPISNAEWITC